MRNRLKILVVGHNPLSTWDGKPPLRAQPGYAPDTESGAAPEISSIPIIFVITARDAESHKQKKRTGFFLCIATFLVAQETLRLSIFWSLPLDNDSEMCPSY